MKGIQHLFLLNKGLATEVINPEVLDWILLESTKAYRKRDGSGGYILNGEIYRRRNAKNTEQKEGFERKGIRCDLPSNPKDHDRHFWMPIEDNIYYIEAFNKLKPKERINGTYELCGSKVQSNAENIKNGHVLINHLSEEIIDPLIQDKSFSSIKLYLETHDIEGIVFRNGDKMCKITHRHFNIHRNNTKKYNKEVNAEKVLRKNVMSQANQIYIYWQKHSNERQEAYEDIKNKFIEHLSFEEICIKEIEENQNN